jgi:hypothetical protein
MAKKNPHASEYIETRLEVYSKMSVEDLAMLAIYFEHHSFLLASELQFIDSIEQQKAEILDNDDDEISDEEIEEKFEELSDVLMSRIEEFEGLEEDFSEEFMKKASPKMQEFLQKIDLLNAADDEEPTSH